ncbi:hypothetical protein [uncultured Rhodoblastus sp.]|uniref:hypothetical protein n=1 Tax=uncultured Rhodoblastus sp. TaxID=543037 RepID=UPI0025E0A0ED|nr:hypothetical protein [uncultured Rhodoblastus sp.]
MLLLLCCAKVAAAGFFPRMRRRRLDACRKPADQAAEESDDRIGENRSFRIVSTQRRGLMRGFAVPLRNSLNSVGYKTLQTLRNSVEAGVYAGDDPVLSINDLFQNAELPKLPAPFYPHRTGQLCP